MSVNPDPVFLKISGLPGFQTFVTFKPDSNEQQPISSTENVGSQLNKFNIVFTLSRPDQALVPSPKVHFASRLKGDSYVWIDTVTAYHLGREDLSAPFIVKAHPNDDGNLGKIEFE